MGSNESSWWTPARRAEAGRKRKLGHARAKRMKAQAAAKAAPGVPEATETRRTSYSSGILAGVVKDFRGKTADQLAELIAERGIHGRMGTTAKCPLALLLKARGTGLYVIGRRYIVRRSGNRIEKVRTPPEMSVFIHRFDTGKYPNLIAPPPRCVHKPLRKQPPRPGQGEKPKYKRSPATHHLAKLVGRFDQP